MLLNFLNVKDLGGSLLGSQLDGLDFDLPEVLLYQCSSLPKIRQISFLQKVLKKLPMNKSTKSTLKNAKGLLRGCICMWRVYTTSNHCHCSWLQCSDMLLYYFPARHIKYRACSLVQCSVTLWSTLVQPVQWGVVEFSKLQWLVSWLAGHIRSPTDHQQPNRVGTNIDRGPTWIFGSAFSPWYQYLAESWIGHSIEIYIGWPGQHNTDWLTRQSFDTRVALRLASLFIFFVDLELKFWDNIKFTTKVSMRGAARTIQVPPRATPSHHHLL